MSCGLWLNAEAQKEEGIRQVDDAIEVAEKGMDLKIRRDGGGVCSHTFCAKVEGGFGGTSKCKGGGKDHPDFKRSERGSREKKRDLISELVWKRY